MPSILYEKNTKSRILLKKTANGSFFLINACQRQRTPYNAPPLTDTTLINIVRSGRESDNQCLTLRVNSVVYAARLNENVIFYVSLLFNN
ncbi:hypothetical protein CKY12_05675 [Photorhabdus sp. S12-55]|nr:hypothetical protein A4R40_00300 [Photorhabdus laumondii subsp. laumondii]RAW66321.1 hypothetical protein CKY15_20545 [Photorhabdus sp. S7-51]RAW71221.1 hypothetical protein CKY14_13070 [Photorhabdus sp. S14-60]RAW77157.1 hypothetical protein CKY06_13280 [Photorhabdus sp. S15-56]RAW87229.1 hypothetical protein CKY09_07220 [Photorhabdus sp. S5P8-50]RAW87878.1 hypothetical protein CKY12_05675 [Photorhabdus sp. S12-55]